jgi:predicted AAA+ superfamily ATPase
VEALVDQIPPLIGSQLSFQVISNDLEISFRTVQNWISILDNMYLTFRISPYSSGKLKLIKKTQRIFMWDWGGLENRGAQFENFVASHLLKFCHLTEDTQGDRMELRYLRDTEGREIDFLILKNKKPLFAVECKTGERSPSPAIHYFKARLPIPVFYQVHLGNKHFSPEPGIEVLPFLELSKKLNLP